MIPQARSVGVIVIGRNEGVRLRRCLRSLHSVKSIVYVDSGSTDDSMTIAAECGVESISLDNSTFFSAGRARNLGFEYLLKQFPDLDAVQFIDGDCELNAEWLEAGLKALFAAEDVAVVCGRRRERAPEQSLFNRLIDLEWDTPLGFSSASGGDFLIRTRCFQTVHGFNAGIRAGEEPELGFRIRKQGWKILRIHQEMTLHDAAIKDISTWWKRERRSGYGGLDVYWRTSGDSNSYFARYIRSSLFWSLGWLTFGCLMLTVCYLLNHPFGIRICALLWLFVTFVQIARIAGRYSGPQISKTDALKLGALTLLSKWPQMFGQVSWICDRLLGRLPRQIEYKTGQTSERAFAS